MHITRRALAAAVCSSLIIALSSCTPAPKTVEIPTAWRSPSASAAPSGGPSLYAGQTPSLAPSGTVTDPSAVPGGASVSPSPGVDLDPAEDVKKGDSKIKVDVGGTKSRLSFSQVVGEPIYSPPDGPVRITWADPRGNILVIGGANMGVGEDHGRPPDVGLSLTLVEPQQEVFTSATGCQVSVTRTEQDFFAGTFKCKKATGDKGSTLDATGEFSVRF